ncbi:MAG TPA: ATP-dependent DNA helicase [Steroidobacteraceae bacterium]|nr:ATP-dependent DNA helicase [Steroidobacteraceae bacterium]
MSYTVSVRALCAFTTKRGDLDMRFTPAPSAQEGMEGHRIVASRRGPRYKAEVSLTTHQAPLTIRGRADGYDVEACRIDECKTFRGELTRMPANHRALHWAQAETYGAQLCRREGLSEMDLALVYFDIDSQKETIFKERYNAQQLEELFVARCDVFAEWASLELAHVADRNAQLARLAFPYPTFHSGQRDLADAVYRAAASAECLIAQAPTGVGKTLGTLFPMLKAMSVGKVDKLFYLTAKSTGRALALDALRTLKRSAPKLRVLDLVAKEKACVQPGKACNGESCPLAQGFYDKLANARADALQVTLMDQFSLREIAAKHQVCPYYLSQEMTKWSDVIVGDYNYYFDYGGMLHTLTLESDWKVGLLVDEAHNLIDRARDMYSVSLQRPAWQVARSAAPPSLRGAIDLALKQWDAIAQGQETAYATYDEVPRELVLAIRGACLRIGELSVRQPDTVQGPLLDLYFDALAFSRLADHFGEHSLFDIERSINGDTSTLSIRNVIPAHFLKHRFSDAQCAALFSATLSPPKFYRDLLGLPKDSPSLDAASPFGSHQLAVRIEAQISTRFRNRAATATAIVELIEAQFKARPGNYLFFASSFEYLSQIWALFKLRNRDARCWVQAKSMSERERKQFVDQFDHSDRGIGFAVLGGSFAEGIDLVGDRLIGAFIATIGLPQINPVNHSMAERMERAFGEGYNYVYLYPGIRKVIQAAGRVIRSTTDEGVIYLIDERYANSEVVAQLPTWWNLDTQAHRGMDDSYSVEVAPLESE